MKFAGTVQFRLTEDEWDLFSRALEAAGRPAAAVARDAALAWAKRALDTPGAVPGGACGSSGGCRARPALWWNRNSKIHLCANCAASCNRAFSGSCTEVEAPADEPISDLSAVVRRTVRELEQALEGEAKKAK